MEFYFLACIGGWRTHCHQHFLRRFWLLIDCGLECHRLCLHPLPTASLSDSICASWKYVSSPSCAGVFMDVEKVFCFVFSHRWILMGSLYLNRNHWSLFTLLVNKNRRVLRLRGTKSQLLYMDSMGLVDTKDCSSQLYMYAIVFMRVRVVEM